MGCCVYNRRLINSGDSCDLAFFTISGEGSVITFSARLVQAKMTFERFLSMSSVLVTVGIRCIKFLV